MNTVNTIGVDCSFAVNGTVRWTAHFADAAWQGAGDCAPPGHAHVGNFAAAQQRSAGCLGLGH